MTALVVTRVGAATGSRAAAAALACAGSDADRAGLLIDVGAPRAPRSSLVASAAARELEERLAAHLPEVGVASRGLTCHMALPVDDGWVERLDAAMPLVRGSLGVVHLQPAHLRAALTEAHVRPAGVLLRADLHQSRALVALAVGDLRDRGIRVAILKRPLSWLSARRAGLGVPGGGAAGLSPRIVTRLLGPGAFRQER